MDGFGLMGEGGQYGGPVGLARSRDPRFAYAQALANSALDTSTPIRSNMQGMGQLAKAAVSAFAMNKLESEYKNRDADYARSIANALQAGQGQPGETKTYPNTPDESGAPTSINWNAVAPDQNRMTNILAANRDTAPMGIQMQMQQMAAQQAMANHLAQAKAMIPINAESQRALIPGEVAKQQALMPGVIQQAGGTAGAAAGATMPFDINKAVQIAAQTAPIKVAEAGGIKAAQLGAENAPTAYVGPNGPGLAPAGSVAPIATKQAEKAGEQGTQNANLEGKMADDFRSEPAVKSFKEVVPIFNSMVDASKNNSRASDLNLVYGLGKIMDPNSVVREGEMVMVKDTAALPDWLVGQINRVNGGAALQAETRNAIMAEAGSRAQNYQAQYDQTAGQYRDIAGRRGLNHQNVVISPTALNKYEPLKGAVTQQQYDALPAGSTYTAPDGTQRVKR